MDIGKKMLHGVMVKWKCDVCGGFESDIEKYFYSDESEKTPEYLEDSLITVKDITEEEEPIRLCPKCVYRCAKMLVKMLRMDL